MDVVFNILRQQDGSTPYIQSYTLDVNSKNTVLDCLNRIKWEQDGSLAFRKNCRNTICGSCSMRINGRSALACKENIGAELQRLQAIANHSSAEPHGSDASPMPAIGSTPLPASSIEPAKRDAAASSDKPQIMIAPMGNMPVIKDLVVDMQPFWNHLEAVEPYVSTKARQVPEREFLQSPEERDRLNQTGNCILCGACYSECNAREVNPDFVGPHALAKAYRMVSDTRDDKTETRIETYNEGTQGVWGCTRCYYCNAVCPMDVAPMDQIGYIKQEILSRKTQADSRQVRHRKVMVDLVKQGGWVDERKFGLQVVGNYFRDIKGLVSLGPLGLRMLMRRKFPLTFEPSEDTSTIRAVIEEVQTREARKGSL